MTLVSLDIKAAVKSCWSFSSPLWKTSNYLCAGRSKLVCTTLIRSAEHWRLNANLCCLYAVLLNLSGSETITMLSQKLFLNLIQLRAGLMSAHPSSCAWAQCGPAGNCALGKHTWEHLSVSVLMATCSDGLVPSCNVVRQLTWVLIKARTGLKPYME